jgi:hypothetical protein
MNSTGIIVLSEEEERLANSLINDGFPHDVLPVLCVLSGSQAYGLANDQSDRDYLGIHFQDTWVCLEHPSFRQDYQVVRKKFVWDGQGLDEVHPGIKQGNVALDSFEIWKFITLLLKGSFVAYELLYLPTILHKDSGSTGFFQLCRQGVTNKIGKAAKGNALHDWGYNKYNRKKVIMAYYRLSQALYMLHEGEFEWNADVLWEYMASNKQVTYQKPILELYRNQETRVSKLSPEEVELVSKDIFISVNEVEKAMISTRLPDHFSEDILKTILQNIKLTRSKMI